MSGLGSGNASFSFAGVTLFATPVATPLVTRGGSERDDRSVAVLGRRADADVVALPEDQRFIIPPRGDPSIDAPRETLRAAGSGALSAWATCCE